MTIKELKEKLNKYNDNLDIVVLTGGLQYGIYDLDLDSPQYDTDKNNCVSIIVQ